MVLLGSGFYAVRGMVQMPVASLAGGGTLWFTNLTLSDPYFILPVACAATLAIGMMVRCRRLLPVHALSFCSFIGCFLRHSPCRSTALASRPLIACAWCAGVFNCSHHSWAAVILNFSSCSANELCVLSSDVCRSVCLLAICSSDISQIWQGNIVASQRLSVAVGV